MKKILTLVLTVALLLSCAMPFASAEEKPTLDVWFAEIAYATGVYTSQGEAPLFQAIEEATGIDINWIEPAAGSDVATAYNLMMAGGDLPDVIWSGKVVENATTYLDDETIIDLTPYFTAETMPNLWALCEANPSYLNAVKLDDGRMFGVPTIGEAESWQGTWVRKDWLEECGLEVPVTLDDWTNMLRVFKEKYGATFTCHGNLGYAFLGAFELVKMDKDNGFYQKDGKVMYTAEQEAYKDYLTYMNGLYAEGLIDPDYVTNTGEIFVNKAANGETGAGYGFQVHGGQIASAQATYGTTGEWIPVEQPVKVAGDRAYVEMALNTTKMATAITTECEDVDTAVKFLDWLYSEESLILFNFGTEGESFEYDENGDPQYTEEFLTGGDGMVENARKWTAIVGNCPTVKTMAAARSRNDDLSNLANAVWQNTWTYAEWAEIVMPMLSPTEDENDETVDIISALDTYVKEATYEFITGTKDLGEFDAFVEELYNIGLEDVKTIRQAQMDRVAAR